MSNDELPLPLPVPATFAPMLSHFSPISEAPQGFLLEFGGPLVTSYLKPLAG